MKPTIKLNDNHRQGDVEIGTTLRADEFALGPNNFLTGLMEQLEKKHEKMARMLRVISQRKD